MAQHNQDSSILDAVELLQDNGFDALAEAVTLLMNTAMVAERSEYLGARPYERTEDRRGYANAIERGDSPAYPSRQVVPQRGILSSTGVGGTDGDRGRLADR